MDQARAERMTRELTGTVIGGWHIKRRVGFGKSALVFEAENPDKKCALKVFDPELIERFGKDTQLGRINRECSLIGKSHPNLINIYGGGECENSNYLYVAMEYIDAPNLNSQLKYVPKNRIYPLLCQIASAARFLEECELAHRDIKPENIIVQPDFSEAILLDLGVLRPFGDQSLTDEDERAFVGTLRYSSPEFLKREERDSVEGWRAVTFYQLGAVLHDLIMQKPIFSEFSSPFALLVEAVERETPIIHSDEINPDLIILAKNCLVKLPGARLKLVSWDDFTRSDIDNSSKSNYVERVKKRRLSSKLEISEEILAPELPINQLNANISNHLESIVRSECAGEACFPPMEVVTSIEDGVSLRVTYSNSENHNLAMYLSVLLKCDVIDGNTKSVSVGASACLHNAANYPDQCSDYVAVFKGPYDSSRASEIIRELLWQILDHAQNLNDSSVLGEDTLMAD